MTKAKTRIDTIIKATVNRRGVGKFINTGYRKYSTKNPFSFFFLLAIALFVLAALSFETYAGRDANSKTGVRVEKVSDGDTIKVVFPDGTKETVRLIGLDTPETHHPTKPVGCFGPEAENYSRNKLDGKRVELEYDIERTDKYGRTLAYVYLNGKRFNDELISLGFAKILSIEPNTKYAREFTQLEVSARKSNLGLWGYCTNDN